MTRIVGSQIVNYNSVSSTMDVARSLAIAGAREGTVVVAEEQTAGRGRLSRRWLAPPGSSLLLSVILKPPPSKLSALSMMAALAVSRSIEQATGLAASIKWPNDVLLGGKKVCGILIESDMVKEAVNWAIIGIGINVNLDVSSLPGLETPATSLSSALGHQVSRPELLHTLLQELDELYQLLLQGQPVQQHWLERLDTLGKEVTVRQGDRIERGVAESVDEQGRLLLRRADGSLTMIVAGDVTLRPS